METDASGAVGLSNRYTAYGEQIAVASGSCAGDQRGFTGQRHDPDTGLIDLHARWYDPALGRFTSADWFDPVDEASALQGAAIGWLASAVGTNRYAYAGDDPVNKADTNGHDVGGFFSAIGNAISSFFSGIFGGASPASNPTGQGISQSSNTSVSSSAAATSDSALGTDNNSTADTAKAAIDPNIVATTPLGYKLDKDAVKDMAKRGWTAEEIDDAVKYGIRVQSMNNWTKQPTATRYVNPTTGKSVVIDDITHEVLHVGSPSYGYHRTDVPGAPMQPAPEVTPHPAPPGSSEPTFTEPSGIPTETPEIPDIIDPFP